MKAQNIYSRERIFLKIYVSRSPTTPRSERTERSDPTWSHHVTSNSKAQSRQSSRHSAPLVTRQAVRVGDREDLGISSGDQGPSTPTSAFGYDFGSDGFAPLTACKPRRLISAFVSDAPWTPKGESESAVLGRANHATASGARGRVHTQ